MSRIIIEYYKISIPHKPIKTEWFDLYKSKITSGQKIDFYGTPTYKMLFKEKGFLSIILAVILFVIWLIMCLFEWKINFEELKGFISLFLFLSIFTFIIPFLSFIQLRYDIRIFNKNVTNFMNRSNEIQEFQRLYDKKYD